MTSNSLITAGNVVRIGATPHPSVSASLASNYDGEWSSTRALAILKRDGADGEIPAAAALARAACAPMDRTRLNHRLTILGAAMAPNRSAQDGAAWLDHMARGIGDLPEDLVLDAIDSWVRSNKFLPTVAELRDLADPPLARRRSEAIRLDTIARLIASGADVPAALPVWTPEHEKPFDEATRCTPEQAAEVLAEFPQIKSETRDNLKRFLGEPRMPTREDYISMGVDPDSIPERVAARG